MKRSKVVVLGGGGFIGTHLCNELVSRGLQVRSFGRTAPHSPTNGVEYINGDFTDETVVANAIEGFDVVYHLIHATTPAIANFEIIGDVEKSVIGTIRLLNACVFLKVNKVIFISSGGTVYGQSTESLLKEDSVTAPISVYGANKVTIENYLRVFHQLHGLDYRIARVSNPFGPFQTGLKNQGLIPTAVRSILDKNAIRIFGDGSHIRDYIFVRDLVRCLVMLLDHQGSERVFNVGGGQGRTILDIVRSVELQLGQAADLSFLPARPFDVPSNVLCIERAKRTLGWAPETEFDSALETTINWLVENH